MTVIERALADPILLLRSTNPWCTRGFIAETEENEACLEGVISINRTVVILIPSRSGYET